MVMTEFEFIELHLKLHDYITIHLNNGVAVNGTLRGQYDSNYHYFEFENHSNGRTEKIKLKNIHMIIKPKLTQ